jgi:hypothetical protein
MAKHGKVLPARKRHDDHPGDDDSLLLRSAESLGRVIGALQRQLDGATKRLSYVDGDGGTPNGQSRRSAPNGQSRRSGKSKSITKRAASVHPAARQAAASSATSPRTGAATRAGVSTGTARRSSSRKSTARATKKR